MPESRDKSSRITFRLPHVLRDEIREVAKRNGMTMTAVILRILQRRHEQRDTAMKELESRAGDGV